VQARDSAVWAARGTNEDLAHIINLIGSGIVRLDDHLIVSLANEAADTFLGRGRGELNGLSAIEALGDHRIEAIATRARAVGWANGEEARSLDQDRVLR